MAGQPKRIGFLADTHSRKPDGSDLPDSVLAAFKGTDLIVHLGDIGRHGILDRLETVAPVLVPAGDGKGYVQRGSADGADPVKVLTSGDVVVGITFNLAQPDKKIAVDGATIDFTAPVPDLLNRRFKQPVDVVAFAGTHAQYNDVHDGVLFFNPGSPTLPADGGGGVAVLDLSAKKPKVKLVRLKA